MIFIKTIVYKKYQEIDPDGSILELNQYLSGILHCPFTQMYDSIEKLLNHIIQKKALHEYGVMKKEINEFTDVVMKKQGRLMANNYVELSREDVMEIYKKLY